MSLGIKHNYFFRKKYIAQDSNERQDAVEEAIARHFLKRQTYGLLSTPAVTGVGPGFIYRVDSGNADPIQGHDLNGLFVQADTQPYATDDLTNLARQGGGFTPPTAGNERYITLVLRFRREESQPEIEKLTFTEVFFRQEASFEIGVIEGAEAALGTAVVPSLAGEDGLYLADILVVDTDADATTTTITYDTSRATIDPIREAADRGLDGIANRLAFTGDIGFISEVRWIASNLAVPGGWLVCDGSTVPQATYPDLYAALGTIWGPDGGGNFTLPDLRGRSPLASGTGPGLTARNVGDIGGEEDHQLTIAEMASHTHAGESGVTLGALANIGLNYPLFIHGQTGAQGGDVPHNTMHPYAALLAIIKAL